MKTTTDLYNDTYRSFTPEWFDNELKVENYLRENSESVMDFFHSYCGQFNVYPRQQYPSLRILDAGCGLGGVAFNFAAGGAQVVGADISALAIMGAKSIAEKKNLNVEFHLMDLGTTEQMLGEFDLIIDSHLLHCLTSNEQRKHYLNWVSKSLRPGGQFFLETMVWHSQMEIPMDYLLDEQMVLHKYLEDVKKYVPVRKVQESLNLEEEIKHTGLDLNYFYYHAELSFDAFNEYKNYPIHKLPRTIRAVATKKMD